MYKNKADFYEASDIVDKIELSKEPDIQLVEKVGDLREICELGHTGLYFLESLDSFEEISIHDSVGVLDGRELSTHEVKDIIEDLTRWVAVRVAQAERDMEEEKEAERRYQESLKYCECCGKRLEEEE